MFSSRGISCRQGPHQLAQKLSITTCPLYWARLILGPLRESRVNCGAGPLALEPATAGTLSSNARIVAIRFFMLPPLEKYGRSDRRFHVVGQLGHAQQVGAEHAVLHLDVDRQPIRRQHAVAATEVHRKAVVARELRGTDAAEKIESSRQGVTATNKGLAREEVVAQADVVIRELPLSAGKQLNIAAQGLKAGAARIGTAVFALEEEVFGDVIGGRQTVGVIGAEVLD